MRNEMMENEKNLETENGAKILDGIQSNTDYNADRSFDRFYD